MKQFAKKLLIIMLILAIIPLGAYAQAVNEYETSVAGYNPNRIINDEDFLNSNVMTIEQIQEFVSAQGGTLDTYVDPAVQMPAYYIIWQTAQEFGVSPKFILTMLQKEQSLVTDPSPTQNQYDWAVGYSCYGGICLDKFKGFSAQIRAMANKFTTSYMADLNVKSKHVSDQYCTFTKWCIGQAKQTQDNFTIIPENRITASLYTYNPYRGNSIVSGAKIGANYNFFKIWNRWFGGDMTTTPTTPPPVVIKPTYRPDGTLIKTKTDSKVYLIEDGKKRPFANMNALISRYDPKNILILPKSEVDKYPIGKEIAYAQYSLLMDEKKQIYLLIDETLKPFASNDVFKTLGFNPEEIINIKNNEVETFATGTPITLKDSYPLGAVLQDKKLNLYYVQAGIKMPIIAKEIREISFPKLKVRSVANTVVDKLPAGDPVLLPDHTLIKSPDSPDVYVIGGGQKHKILSESAFISRGYDWKAIHIVPQSVLDIHKNGVDLDAVDIIFGPEDELNTASTTTTSTPVIKN